MYKYKCINSKCRNYNKIVKLLFNIGYFPCKKCKCNMKSIKDDP